MKVRKILFTTICITAFTGITAFGGSFQKSGNAWWYDNGNGTYPKGTWAWLDPDNDGMAQCYYFDDNGWLLTSARTPDGHFVNDKGAWMLNNQEQVRYVAREGGHSGSGISSKTSTSNGKRSTKVSGHVSTGGETAAAQDTAIETTQVQSTQTQTTTAPATAATTAASKRRRKKKGGNQAAAVTTAPETAMPTAAAPYSGSQVRAMVDQGLSEKEAQLYLEINAYRTSQGLSPLSCSKSLTQVARTHVQDSNQYHPENQKDPRGIQGDLHSWSSHGHWTGFAYTPDQYYLVDLMKKPSEITSYPGSGYEISAYYNPSAASPMEITAALAVYTWKHSTEDNALLTSSGNYKNIHTMGVGISGNYAHVWFGEVPDPQGYYTEK